MTRIIFPTKPRIKPNHKPIRVLYRVTRMRISGKRISSHNYLSKKGWTIKFRPWSIIYSEQYPTKQQAINREKELKSARGRMFIWELIKRK